MGKQGSFLAAGTGANLQNDAFFVIGIFGQKQQLEILPALRQIAGNLAKLLLYHSGKRRVSLLLQQLLRLLLLLL